MLQTGTDVKSVTMFIILETAVVYFIFMVLSDCAAPIVGACLILCFAIGFFRYSCFYVIGFIISYFHSSYFHMCLIVSSFPLTHSILFHFSHFSTMLVNFPFLADHCFQVLRTVPLEPLQRLYVPTPPLHFPCQFEALDPRRSHR